MFLDFKAFILYSECGNFFSGLGKVKPVWLAEIGSRTVEKFDGSMWSQLPSMNRAKVEHACTVATVNDQRGILVVGGATGDDMVEFLNWEDQKEWKQLGKINRGRGTNTLIRHTKKLY